MRSLFLVLAPALALGVAACSEGGKNDLDNSLARTGDSIENAASSAGDAIGNGLDRAGNVIDDTADDIGNRAEGVGNAIDTAVSGKAVNRDGWLGRWIGVEGLNLTVAKGKEAGHYKLTMQYGTDADMKGTYDGVGTSAGIKFTRPDGEQTLRATDGDGTGLKYLAGKKNCLTVKSGEGYCKG